ncbi:protein mitoshell [Topomyia yanbarensis]|uniref:protein mitoshell n=1 Tax=Topomyia yanbarensis TaxID=2498891 RepID=UPI00273A9530|nr:protein mitoshell [Topomyia yanbarensis]XP_058821832.1 protein mitoshell [Topomyia yanbarensis]
MTEESFNKAPGSEFSKIRSSTVVTIGNMKVAPTTSASSAILQERPLTSSASTGLSMNQDLPYTILQYGHLLPTLLQPGFSVYHPPPPPLPVTIPVFYQPVNGAVPQPQPFDANMFYRCMPQLPTGNDVVGQKINQARKPGKVVQSKMKFKEPAIDVRRQDVLTSGSDGSLSPITLPLITTDSPREIGFGGTGIVVHQEKLVTLTEMAMQGCEVAEQLANNHQKRPCFKKIDSLCARMKQDLIRPDSVLANINSQGMAWAVKDFIFVFTRIINAWIIIKGYVYNTPEGLDRVQKVLSPDFLDNFLKWQDSTIDFVDSLIKSFTSLDQMVQNQRTSGVQKESIPKGGGVRQSKTDEEKERGLQELYEYLKDIIPNLTDNKASSSSDNASSSDLSDRSSVIYDNSKNYLVPVVNDSEQTQMKHNEHGTYFKTGIYEPVKKPPGFGSSPVACSMKMPFPLTDTNTFVTSTPKILKNPSPPNRHDLLGSVCNNSYDSIHAVNQLTDISLSLQMDFFNDAIIRQTFDSETVAKIHFLLQKMFTVNETKYFFDLRFSKNYFPDFHTVNPSFIDIRSIISKAQIGGYHNIHEIVYDLRQIVQAARHYLEQKPHLLLKETADEFERNLEDILSDKIFDCYDFSCLPGSTSPAVTTSSNSSTMTACSGDF